MLYGNVRVTRTRQIVNGRASDQGFSHFHAVGSSGGSGGSGVNIASTFYSNERGGHAAVTAAIGDIAGGVIADLHARSSVDRASLGLLTAMASALSAIEPALSTPICFFDFILINALVFVFVSTVAKAGEIWSLP